MYFGIIVIIIGILWYITYMVIYNYYLRKNAPDLLQSPSANSCSKGRKDRNVRVVITEGLTPGWVALVGIPPIPIFLLGLLITIVALVPRLFR